MRHLLIKATDTIPSDITKDVMKIIDRIISNPDVLGILYFRNGIVHMCTVPSQMHYPLTTMLPPLSPLIHKAVSELDVRDELIAYRISTNSLEILVTGGKDIGAVVVQTKGTKKVKDKKK